MQKWAALARRAAARCELEADVPRIHVTALDSDLANLGYRRIDIRTYASPVGGRAKPNL
jgi:hypothetical protein